MFTTSTYFIALISSSASVIHCFNIYSNIQLLRAKHSVAPSYNRFIFCSKSHEINELTSNTAEVHPSTSTVLRRKRRSSREATSIHESNVDPSTNSTSNKVKTSQVRTLEPVYWREERDSITIEHHQELSNLKNYSVSIHDYLNSPLLNQTSGPVIITKRIQFQVHGNPLPLRRHRTAHGFMYNPSAAAQRKFQEVVMSMLPKDFMKPLEDNIPDPYNHSELENIISPFFQADEQLSVHIIFYMKRPKTHFVAGKSESRRIRSIYQGLLPHRSKTDVDNLAKFVLDSLNGLLYVDDRQIVSLHLTKLLHSEDDFKGLTRICIENLHESHVMSYLDRYHHVSEFYSSKRE